MTKQQLVEMVQEHHPNLSETQILIYINSAMDEFCRKTRILTTAYQITTVENKRYYDLDDEIVEITSVDFDGYEIPLLTGRPEKRDLT